MQKPQKISNVVSQNIFRILVFLDLRQIEGIDVVAGIKGNLDESAADSFAKMFVFVFRINNDNIDASISERRTSSFMV